MSVEFSRVFSMGGFEALRALRKHQHYQAGLSLEELGKLVSRVEVDAPGLDFEAAVHLSTLVDPACSPEDAPHFYRVCVESVILKQRPTWVKIMTLGRLKFVDKLSVDERQCFRDAGLLGSPPTTAVREWWDRVTAEVRHANEQAKLARSRQAEELSFNHEVKRLAALGIAQGPEWTALEDNVAGYDIRSYDPGVFGPTARLIEVKSSISNPLKFIISRNEWEQAQRYGASYHIHVWDMRGASPILHQRTMAQIQPHIPTDNEKGRWGNAEIPIGHIQSNS